MKMLERVLYWAVIVGIFALPLVAFIVANSLFFPFITGKNFTFRIIIDIISGLWLALALIYPRYRPQRSWILGCFAIFVFIMAIADAQGAMPFKSFWSNFERMDGWITIAHTLLLLVVAAAVLNTEKLWQRLFQWSIVVSLFLSLWGIAQVAGIATVSAGGSGGLGGRIDVSFGNPIYLAVYMLFHVFLAALLWQQLWVASKKGERLWPSIFYGSAIILDTIALLFTSTRGTILGLIGGAFLALIIYVIQPDGKMLRKTAAICFSVLIVGGGVLWIARDTALVQNVGFLNRLSSISLNDNDTKARLLNIEIAWQGVKERPLLGWGQENYAIVFDKYYDPRMYGQEQWFDRVHDIVFDWWVAGGTLGLVAYLSILVAALWVLWKSPAFSSAERAILIGLLAAYFVHNIFVFDNVTSYILFAMVLGYVVFRDAAERKTRVLFETKLLPIGALPVVAVVGLVLGLGSAWLINANAYAANLDIITGLDVTSVDGLSTSLAGFENAIALGTYGTQEAREQLSQMATNVVGASVPDSVKQQWINTSLHELDLQSQWSPLDARFPLFAGALLDSAGDYKDAAVYLMRAHTLSPAKQTILLALAQNAQAQGQTQAELQYFQQAFQLDTDYLSARLYYAAALISAGQDAQADAILAPVIPTGGAADTRINAAYAARGEYSKLIPIWQAAVKADPTTSQNYLTLAAVYYAAGDKVDAIATLQSAIQQFPASASDIQALITQVQNGTAKLGS